MELKGKSAVVTGSARGIGREIALMLARAGADVVISDLNEEAGLEVVEEIKGLGRKSIWVKADVSRFEEAEKLIHSALEAFEKIDILVNNAGITRDNLMMRMSDEEWQSVINVNLTGTYNCVRAATKSFMKQRAGKIINIASVVGQMGNPGQANYAASKAGVIGLTKSVAKEFASRNVNVNAVAPGFIQTAMTDKLPEKAKEALMGVIPMGRLGQPEDVAKAVLFLASEASAYMTGQVINVDGGMVM
jgi:3-oxoacyl-[acyl-carrier protein] reductase